MDLARAPYAELGIRRIDEDGDGFMWQWSLTNQGRGFQVYGAVMDPDPPEWAWLGAWGFAGATTVSAYDPVTQASANWTFTAYQWGSIGPLDIAAEWDVRPGQTFTINDATGVPKTVVFPELAVTATDPAADTISGLCDPDAGTPVDITRWYEPWPTVHATCGPAGTFAADSSGVFDIQPGDQLQAVQDDGDGDYPSVHWRVPLGYDFGGFLAPVDSFPTLNQTKAGQAIPVNFSLTGDHGLDIFDAGSPSSQGIACDSNAPVDGIEETVIAGNSSLSYDALADRYTYVWKTRKDWAGTCRQLIVELNDGSVWIALFKLK